MTLAPSYACFGCVDFANNARTKAYVAWACATGKYTGDPQGMIRKSWSLCECDLDDDAWVDPITDNVCWYDPLVPESADFLGAAIVGSSNMRSSSFRRELSSALNGGTILMQPTVDGKQFMLEIELYATSQAGMNYGIQWLRSQFEGDQRCPQSGASCASCQGQLFTARMHCPPAGALDDGLHSWAAAGTIDGFQPVDDSFPLGRRNCEKATFATITMATEQHGSYSTNPTGSETIDMSGAFTALGNCLLETNLPTLGDICCPICSEGCDPCTTDPGCDCLPPFTLEPEIVSAGAPCFSDPVCRCIGAMAITGLPAGYETALRMTIRSGTDPLNAIFERFGMRNFVFRVFENPATSVYDPFTMLTTDYPEGLPLPVDQESYEMLTGRQLPCAEVGVSWMPASSDLIVDGLSGQTWLKCKGKCVDHSSRVDVISGSIFPLKAHCTNLIITVEWDCLNAQSRVAPETVLSALTVETFLGFNL